MRAHIVFLFLILTAATSTSTSAAAITNLTDEPQIFSVIEWSGERLITIPPGRTFRLIGDVDFRYQGREVRIDEDEEYALWKDGTFGPQKRLNRNSPFSF